MELEIPSWLDEKFLCSSLLEESPDEPISILDYAVEPAVAAGNNYGSVLYRVLLTYKTQGPDHKSSSLIVKAPLKNEMLDFLNEIWGMAEYNFYYTYLPTLREFSQFDIAPKVFKSSVPGVIVLEDLKKSGFTMQDRHKQLDLEHCKQYYITSAKLHAAGVLIAKQYPDFIQKFPSARESMGETHFKTLMKTIFYGIKCLVKAIEFAATDLEDYKEHLEILKKLFDSTETENYWMKWFAEMKTMFEGKGFLKTFIHGDCWTTNMMFKHNDSGKPIDIRLIDFQIFNYDTNINDLINFTWMSANNEVLENNLDELYHLYCDTLNDCLAGLGCSERLSYEELKTQLHLMSFQVIVMLAVVMPVTLAEEPVKDLVLFSDSVSEEKLMVCYQGQYFHSKFPYVLKCAARQGVFDNLQEILNQWEDLKNEECLQ